jgi:streptogramin lyase
MEEFQQVRNRFPESPWAESALERITALYRLHAGGKPTFTLDPGFSVAGGNVLKDVRALLVAPDRRLWIASKKTRSAVGFDTSGKMGESLPGREPRTLSLSPDGEVVFAARTAVRIGPRDIRSFSFPPEKPDEEPKPVDRILAAAVVPGGSILVSDERNDTVFRFGAQGELQGRFLQGDARKREVRRIVLDGERGIYLLDRKEKTVLVCDDSGRTLRTIGPGGLRKPADVAVDAFLNVYVADEDQGVLVFDPGGQLFFKATGPEMKKATAVALDASGAVLVYDDGSDQVRRYR